ncbi:MULTISPECIES: ABC transporter substrate-binding protein [Microbacterium]|jgi:peptide/nickel transport system substrate-binding protein|uniref:ABC transporter substrate-binding protein n=1 Tax=Microbacterium galbinum TaxID=2851646 RepID=A0ABY4IQS6_9MICO|nr:ABC transporter substrate-binding protein [Microbacterium galbinum]MCK2029067.1 ABC transporter substrate-binding protein [Microbacterium galbinum]UPL15139.1 ABC transporter substrate-binding protein [Microbacterium galbinum]
MIRNGKRKIALTAVAGASVLALGLTACGSGGSGDSDANGDRALRVWAGSQTPITANYNPFAPTVLHGALGPIYEPLFFFNKTADTEPVGLIGDTYEYNEDGTVITVTIKPDLKWSDGEPLTAADVAFSFGYEANSPEANGLVSAEATDDTTVVLTYDSAQYTTEFQRLGSTYILPEHIWKDVDDYANFANEDPVGSGAYVVDKTTSESYTLVANENFRDAADLGVKKVQYIAVDNNQTAQDLLAAGKLDWTGMFIPNPDDVTANGAIDWINTPQDPTVLYTCSNADLGCTGPQTDVAVRQALNAAIDRGTIKEKAFVDLTAEISPTYALLPRDEKWVADPANELSPQEANAAEAGSILEAAGYTKGSDGIYEKDGVPVELSLTSVDGWTDYNDAAKLIAEQAEAAGIKINASTVQWQEFSDTRQSGEYQLIVGGMIGTSVADPFQIYRDWFGGTAVASTGPVGEEIPTGRWNFSRYDNPTVDAAIQSAISTNDEATKKELYATIQTEIVRDLPYIPLVINATQTFYNTKDYTGWPTEDDLYAFPPSWGAIAAGYVLTHLQPVE